MPFAMRVSASVDECIQASGISRSVLYHMMRDGLVEYRLLGRHRVVLVASLLKALGVNQDDAA
jgi:hypothetical protein